MKIETAEGFTLTEFLVVIAIMAILLALLVPGMAKFVNKGEAATCLGNLRQIGGLIGIYVADHDGWLPSATDYDPSKPPMTGTPSQYTWDEKMVMDGVMGKDDLRLTRSGCPANKKMTKGCYGYNYEQLGNENRPQGPRLVKISAIEQPSQTVMVMDNWAYSDGTGWSLLAWWHGTDPSDASAPGAPVGHDGFVNVLWVDGHAGAMKLKELYTHDPENGFNPDRPTPWYFAARKVP